MSDTLLTLRVTSVPEWEAEDLVRGVLGPAVALASDEQAKAMLSEINIGLPWTSCTRTWPPTPARRKPHSRFRTESRRQLRFLRHPGPPQHPGSGGRITRCGSASTWSPAARVERWPTICSRR